ncbi:adenylyltransferase/cytidyltransferase family protein [Chloroflexota bacterium]
MTKKKVLVSGCFDMLHSGHIEFIRQAAQYGDLYVALGSDRTIFNLKGRETVNDQHERLFMVRSIRGVKDAYISKGSGHLDFVEEMKELKPDYFVVNQDGHTPQKVALCMSHDVEYIVLERTPHKDLSPRSTTDLRSQDYLPYRIDLAGGWLDQPYVSKYHPGSVVTISLEPTLEFNERSGMATSTRNHARELWGQRIPPGSYEKLARILFRYDNPPGTEVISGSQDSIGLIFPGLAKAHYDGGYWPERIDHSTNELLLHFVETSLQLLPLGPRQSDYDVLADTNINKPNARLLADAARELWNAVHQQDFKAFGQAMRAGFEAQVRMFPNMMNGQVADLIVRYQGISSGWKLSGAGGGGYLILVTKESIPNAVQITARREL